MSPCVGTTSRSTCRTSLRRATTGRSPRAATTNRTQATNALIGGNIGAYADALLQLNGDIRMRFHGVAVAYTEPVPGYLVSAAGLRNLAPDSFTRSIEDGTEPSPSAVSAMSALVDLRRIRVLLYNAQAVSSITGQLRAAAQKAGIPVVAVRETLPQHLTFQQWQLQQARALAAALAR